MKISVITPEMAWQLIRLLNKRRIFSTKQKRPYDLRFSKDKIHLKATTRNGGVKEVITKNEFVDAFAKISTLSSINTNSIKDVIPKSLYIKRSPLIAVLYAAGILIK